MAANPKKISELDPIKISEISDDDVILVSDYNKGTCVSKKMTMKSLVQYICSKIPQNQTVVQNIEQIAENQVQQILQEESDEIVVNAVQNNVEEIADILFDGNKDNEILIDGGNADLSQ